MRKFLIWSILVMTMMIPMAVSADTDSSTMTTLVKAQVISFSLNDKDLDFGEVIVGTDSNVVTFVITNTGNIPITVETSVAGGSSGLYAAHLQLQQGGWSYSSVVGWKSPSIAPLATLTINAKLVEPSDAFVGTKTGTLTFLSAGS